MVAVSHDSMGAPGCYFRGWPLAGYQHGEKHAATAKLTPETNTATTTQMPDFEAFLILTPMPRSAAGPLAGLPVVDETDPVGEERFQGGNLLLWHWLERWLCPREVTFCSGICSSGGFAPGR